MYLSRSKVKPGCFCSDGFVLDPQNPTVCVAERDCKVECPGDQVWVECLDCWQNCGEPELCFGLSMNGECNGGCRCPKGTQFLGEDIFVRVLQQIGHFDYMIDIKNDTVIFR